MEKMTKDQTAELHRRTDLWLNSELQAQAARICADNAKVELNNFVISLAEPSRGRPRGSRNKSNGVQAALPIEAE